MTKEEKSFEEIVKSLTSKQIIMAMVDSLTPPPTIKIDMETYGVVRWDDDNNPICYGCAATNTICKISGKVFTSDNVGRTEDRAIFINSSKDFLDSFELAIDCLRRGDAIAYNYYAEEGKFACIENFDKIALTKLTNDYTLNDLKSYKKLAKAQPIK